MLQTLYRPITAQPFRTGKRYSEVPPCAPLQPFITCYWGSEDVARENAVTNGGLLVIPDTCMDIILEINHTRNTMVCFFSGLQDEAFFSRQLFSSQDMVSRFAIRFHFWAVHLFMDIDLFGARNRNLYAEDSFPEWLPLFDSFYEKTTLTERIAVAERFLLARLDDLRMQPDFMNAIYYLLHTQGTRPVRECCEHTLSSSRRLERLFRRNTGASVKRVSSLIRYQNLWQSMALTPSFDAQDAVLRFGYTDQSHMLREFKRYHGLNPKEALRMAHSIR